MSRWWRRLVSSGEVPLGILKILLNLVKNLFLSFQLLGFFCRTENVVRFKVKGNKIMIFYSRKGTNVQ